MLYSKVEVTPGESRKGQRQNQMAGRKEALESDEGSWPSLILEIVLCLRCFNLPGMRAHAFNPSTSDAEAVRSL